MNARRVKSDNTEKRAPLASVGRFLRKQRQAMGYSLRQVERLAEEQGAPIPFATLSRIEKGKVDPGVGRLRVLLDVYGVSPRVMGEILELERLAGSVTEDVTDLEELFDRAKACAERGETRRALAYLRALMEMHPSSHSERRLRQCALIGMVNLSCTLGKEVLAKEVVDRLLLEPPLEEYRAIVLWWAALVHTDLGAADVGLGLLARCEEVVQPGDSLVPHIDIARSRAYIVLEEVDKARAVAKRVLEKSLEAEEPYIYFPFFGALVDFEMRHQCGEAAGRYYEEMERIFELHADDIQRLVWRWHRARGLMATLRGDHRGALREFQLALAHAIEIDSSFARVFCHHALWKVSLALGDKESADIELRSALRYVRTVDSKYPEFDELRKIGEMDGLGRASLSA